MRAGNTRRRIRDEKSVKTHHRESVDGSLGRPFLGQARRLGSRKTERVERGFRLENVCISAVISEMVEKNQKQQMPEKQWFGDSRSRAIGRSENAKKPPPFLEGLPTIRESEKTLWIKYSKNFVSKSTKVNRIFRNMKIGEPETPKKLKVKNKKCTNNTQNDFDEG